MKTEVTLEQLTTQAVEISHDIADDVNLYAYVGNNPVNFSDPSGLKEKTSILEKISLFSGAWTVEI